MKIFRNAPFYYWLIIGLFLVIYAGFGVVFYQKQAESQDIEAQTAPKRLILQKPRPDLEKLEKELSQAEEEINTMWTFLPIPEEAIELIDALVEVAQLSDVEVLSVTGAPPATKRSGDEVSYSVFSFNMTVQGSQNAILTFISNLSMQSELLRGLDIESLDISSSSSADAPNTANLRLVIPTRPHFTT